MRFGERIAGAGGLLLLASLFLPWYGVDIQVADVSLGGSFTAWEALSVIDLLLAAIALVAIIVALLSVTGPPASGRIALLRGAGLLGLALILYRIVDLPLAVVTPEASGDSIELGRRIGILVALLGAAAVAYGGSVAVRR